MLKEEKLLSELAIFNTYKTDEEKLDGIKEYYPKWRKTFICGTLSEQDIINEAEMYIQHCKNGLKSFGVNWSGIFYGTLPSDFVIFWGKQLDYYKENYKMKFIKEVNS